MIGIHLQRGEGKAACPQCVAVACMLLQHLVIARNSQLNRGESLGEIFSRNTNNGVLEQLGVLSFHEFVVNKFGGSDVLNRDAD